jgi:hypothetical protein
VTFGQANAHRQPLLPGWQAMAECPSRSTTGEYAKQANLGIRWRM